jgi:hypothetical protein
MDVAGTHAPHKVGCWVAVGRIIVRLLLLSGVLVGLLVDVDASG